MGKQLPEEKLNRLLPAVSLLAKCIGAGGTPDQHTLKEILHSIGVQEEGWALQELEFWGRKLQQARTVSSDTEKTTIAAELQGRGIPIAPAILAVDATIPPPLIAEPQSINFGCLKPGEGANATLKVSGQLLKVTVRDSRLKVTLLDRGSGNSLVKVQLLAGSSGESLQDSVVLQGDRGELRVPVTASWQVAAEGPPLLSWCPRCADKIKKKSLFYNRYTREYECFHCKHKFPYPDERVSLYNSSHS